MLVVFALVAAAGCGGAPAQPAAPAPSTGSARSAPPAPATARSPAVLPSVTLGEAAKVINSAPIEVAAARGLFRQQGADVRVESLGGSAVTGAALSGGSIQFAFESAAAMLLGRGKGLPLISVADLDVGVPLQLIVTQKWLRVHRLSPSQPFVTLMHGLRGSVLANVGPTSRAYMDWLLRRAGMSTADITVVDFHSDTGALAAMQRGLADEVLFSAPASVLAASQGYGTVLVDPRREFAAFRRAYDAVVVTTTAYAASHPRVVHAVAAAIGQGNDAVRSDPASAARIEAARFGNLSPTIVETSLKQLDYAPGGRQDQTDWNATEALFQQTGLLKAPVPVAQNQAWTNRFLGSGT